MTRRSIIALLGALAALPALANPVTVGSFYTEIAKMKQHHPADAASAETSLRAAGYQLPTLALGKTLTEGDIASIGNALGLNVITSRPTEPVTDVQLGRFVSSFGMQMGGSEPPSPYSTDSHRIHSHDDDPGNSGNSKSKGKGKKKGHNKSPSHPI
jgi:hypothetical protein